LVALLGENVVEPNFVQFNNDLRALRCWRWNASPGHIQGLQWQCLCTSLDTG